MGKCTARENWQVHRQQEMEHFGVGSKGERSVRGVRPRGGGGASQGGGKGVASEGGGGGGCLRVGMELNFAACLQHPSNLCSLTDFRMMYRLRGRDAPWPGF